MDIINSANATEYYDVVKLTSKEMWLKPSMKV